jgi:hypothetical protein
MLQEFNNWVQNHPEFSVISIVIGILGFFLTVFGIIQNHWFRKVRGLSYSILGRNLIRDYSESLGGLEIKLKGEKVKTLSVVKIAIWNNGNETLDKHQLVEKDKLRIEISNDTKVFDYSIIQVNESSNSFNLKKLNPNIIEINFDYIDQNQGCVIQIIYDGIKTSDINLKGKIKGIKCFKEVDSFTKKIREVKAANSLIGQKEFVVGLVGSWTFVLIGLSYILYNIRAINIIAFIIILLILVLIGWVLLDFTISLFWRKLPKGLNSIESSFDNKYQ